MPSRHLCPGSGSNKLQKKRGIRDGVFVDEGVSSKPNKVHRGDCHELEFMDLNLWHREQGMRVHDGFYSGAYR